MISAMASAWPSSMLATIGVATTPGQTTLTRTPRGAYSTAALFVRPMTPVLGRVVRGALRQAHEAAEGGAVDDHSGALGAHLAQLVLLRGPDASQVDGVDAVEVLGQIG